jgi:hypothetical protein
MDIPKGGRGQKAPYETQLVRVPVPIKALVELASNVYRSLVVGDKDENIKRFKAEIEVAAMRFHPDKELVNKVRSESEILVDRYSKICQIVDRYERSAKGTRDWTKASQLISELKKVISGD